MRLRRLQIEDSRAPDEQKRVERQRLNALIALCEAPCCRRQTLLGYALIFPSLFFFGAFYIYPVVYSLYLSVFDWDLVRPKRFIGFANYHDLLASAEFGEVLGNTFRYSLGVVVLAIIFTKI